MTFSFLADEHVKRVFITELRANGYDVAWVDGGYERGTPDVEHLESSEESGRVILSNDADFARLHDDYDHAGVVLYNDQNVSVRAFVRAIKQVERLFPETELRGQIVWLDDWFE